MSDLFNMFEEVDTCIKQPSVKDIADEIIRIAAEKDCVIPMSVASELADTIVDRPPWAPWTV